MVAIGAPSAAAPSRGQSAADIGQATSRPTPGTSSLARLKDSLSLTRVRLFMAVKFMETPVRLTPEQLMRTGCSLETTDPAAKTALIALLDRAHVAPAPAPNRELRRLVIFEFLDGSEIRLEFDPVYPKDEHLFGRLDGIPITADKHLEGDLLEWASTLSDRSRCGPGLDAYR